MARYLLWWRKTHSCFLPVQSSKWVISLILESHSLRREPVPLAIFGMKGPGLGRLEITIKDDGEEREFDITAWWHPQGFPGLLYWFAMMPAHLFIFKGMVKAIAKEAEALEENKTK